MALRTCRHTIPVPTGEISGAMLAKLGCTYVTVGTPERRQYHDEGNELVNQKVHAASAMGSPHCLHWRGVEIRKARAARLASRSASSDGALAGLDADKAASVVIAYETGVGDGTGEVATPEDAQEVCSAIRTRLGELYSPQLAGMESASMADQ